MTDLLRRTVGAAAEQSVFNEVMDLMQSGDLLRSDLNKIVFQAANQEDSQAREILVKMGVENGQLSQFPSSMYWILGVLLTSFSVVRFM